MAVVFAAVLPIPWYALVRPDAMTALWGIAAVALYSIYLLQSSRKHGPLLLLMCSSLGVLAFLTKQNGAIFLISVGLFAVVRLKFHELLYMSAGAILTLLLTSLMFHSYYSLLPAEDNYIYRHIIDGVNNGIDVQIAYNKLYTLYFGRYLPLFVLPLSVVVYLIWLAQQSNIRHVDQASLFLSLAFIIVTIANLFAGLKVGSAIHYMNEPMLIALLLLVRFVTIKPFPLALTEHMYIRLVVTIALTCFLAALLVDYGYTYRRNLAFLEPRTEYDTQINDFLQDELRANPDALIFSYHRSVNNVFFEHVLFPQTEVSRMNYSRNLVDYSGAQSLIDTGRLRYIVVPANRRPAEKLFGIPFDELKRVKRTGLLDVYLNLGAAIAVPAEP